MSSDGEPVKNPAMSTPETPPLPPPQQPTSARPPPPTLPAPPPQVIPADVIYASLGDPVRRRLLQTLADGKPRTATMLTGSSGRRLDATLKHLVNLRAAGLVHIAKNPTDGRRQHYQLNPAIPVTKTATGWEIEFGYCLVRC